MMMVRLALVPLRAQKALLPALSRPTRILVEVLLAALGCDWLAEWQERATYYY
jgi:hypothetical protein